MGLRRHKQKKHEILSSPGRGSYPSIESEGSAVKRIRSGLLGEISAEDLQIFAHLGSKVAQPLYIALAARAESAVDGVGKQRVEIEGQPVLFADAGGGGVELLLVIKGTGGGIWGAHGVVGREDVGGIAWRHDGECAVADIDAVAGDAGQRVWHGRVPIVLVEERCGVGNFAVRGDSGGWIRRQATGVVEGAGVSRCESDKFVADAGGQAFEEVGDPQAEVNIVNNAGAKGFDGFVE